MVICISNINCFCSRTLVLFEQIIIQLPVRSIARILDLRPVTRGDIIHPASLLENHQIPIWKSILIKLGLYPSSQSEHDKSYFWKFKRWKWPFCFWMESILLGHIYHVINNDSCEDILSKIITGHMIQKSQYETCIKQYILMKYNNNIYRLNSWFRPIKLA